MNSTVKNLRVTYDSEVDAAYIYLTDIPAGAAKRQVEVEGIRFILDFDEEDRLLGIEVLGQQFLPKGFLDPCS